MVTNNFKNAILNQAFNYNSSKFDGFKDIAGNIPSSATSVNNILRALEATATDIDLSASTTNATGLCICAGTGTTPATTDDLTLESPISISDISCFSTTSVFGNNNTRIITSLLENLTDEDIIITETGLLMDMHVNSYYSYKILLDRTVLSTPITIPAGQSKSITYEITF